MRAVDSEDAVPMTHEQVTELLQLLRSLDRRVQSIAPYVERLEAKLDRLIQAVERQESTRNEGAR